MANPSWPTSLPQYVLQSGYNEEPLESVIRTPVEGGNTKSRRRFTGKFMKFDVRLMMTEAQAVTFEDFYWNTLKAGTLPFEWVHPRTRSAKTMKLLAPPKASSSDGNFTYSLRLEMKL